MANIVRSLSETSGRLSKTISIVLISCSFHLVRLSADKLGSELLVRGVIDDSGSIGIDAEGKVLSAEERLFAASYEPG
jgi:hypothetical protein